MADLNFTATVGEVTSTAAAKTYILATAPTNQRIRIKGVEFFGKGSSNTDLPFKIELVKAASITGGTAGTAPTTGPLDTEYAETIQTALTGNYSAEPTYNTSFVMRTWECHPQTGFAIYFPMHDEIKLKGANVLGVRVTGPASTPNFSLNLIIEE